MVRAGVLRTFCVYKYVYLYMNWETHLFYRAHRLFVYTVEFTGPILDFIRAKMYLPELEMVATSTLQASPLA
jgi:hypothetical protein